MTSPGFERLAAVIAGLQGRLLDAGPRFQRSVRERPRELLIDVLLCVVIVALAADLIPVSGGLALAIASLVVIVVEHERDLGRAPTADRSCSARCVTRGDGS